MPIFYLGILTNKVMISSISASSKLYKKSKLSFQHPQKLCRLLRFCMNRASKIASNPWDIYFKSWFCLFLLIFSFTFILYSKICQKRFFFLIIYLNPHILDFLLHLSRLLLLNKLVLSFLYSMLSLLIEVCC